MNNYFQQNLSVTNYILAGNLEEATNILKTFSTEEKQSTIDACQKIIKSKTRIKDAKRKGLTLKIQLCKELM